MSYLKMFFNELERIKPEDYIEPPEKIKLGDNFVGELPDELKRLYTLWRKKPNPMFEKAMKVFQKGISASFESILSTITKIKEGKGLEELLEEREIITISDSELTKLERECDIIRELFWFSVSHEFGLFDKPIVAVRKGFKAV